MDQNQKLDAEFVEKLAGILNEGELQEIEVKSEEFEIRIVKNPENPSSVTYSGGGVAAAPAMAAAPVAAPAPVAAAPAAPADMAENPNAQKSPMVGTAYLASAPNKPNFVEVGDNVKKGQTLLIVEAMKTMNSIPAEKDGKITAILVSNEDPVEFGQPLVVIE